MKKIFYISLILFFAVSVAYSLISPLVVTALNTSTFVAITLPDSNDAYQDVSIWTEDGTAFTISDTSAGTISGVVPANTPISIGDYEGGGIVLYAKASAGTPNLVMLYKRAR